MMTKSIIWNGNVALGLSLETVSFVRTKLLALKTPRECWVTA